MPPPGAQTINSNTTQIPTSPGLTPPATSSIDFSNPNAVASGAGLGAVTGSTGTVYPPGVTSMTPYSLGQMETEAGAISVGPDIAALLDIAPGNYSMPDLLSHFNSLSREQLIQLQGQLAAGGFYTDSSGQPMANPPTYGAHDNQSFMAFANALMQTAQLGHTADQKGTTNSVDTVIANNISSGLGQIGKAASLSPTVEGGNTYQIDLTNPAAVREQATGIFQAALGRNPTQDELSRITTYVQGGEAAFQGARNQQAENASQAKFQADLTAKQAANAPQVTLGPVPNGPFNSVGQWAAAFLQYLGGGNTNLVTSSNIAMIMGWAKANGDGLDKNNPLGVTLAEPGSEQTKGGTLPSAQSYNNPADGMRATAQTLANFPLLMQALESGDGAGQLGNKAFQDELRQWSSGGYSDITKQVSGSQKQAASFAQQYGAGQPGTAAATAPQPSVNVPAGAVGTSQEAKLAQSQYENQLAQGQQAGTPQDPAVAATLQAGATNPAVGAYLQAGYNEAHGLGDMVAPQTASLGQQPVAPGTTYIPSTTLTQVQPATAEQAAYQAATTGANRIEYGAMNYLNLFKGLMSFIQQGGFK